MKSTKLYIALLSTLLFLGSCGPKIYMAPNFQAVKPTIKTIAILPAAVSIQSSGKQLKNTSADAIKQQASQSGYDIQDKMYSWFLNKQKNYHYSVKFQDISTTNNKLKNLGITYDDIQNTETTLIASKLGVDAVIQTRVTTEHPISEAGAIVVGLISNVWGKTNKVIVNMNIYSKNEEDLIWRYEYTASGSVGSSTSSLVDRLMRNVSKKFPFHLK